jgi:hypothetical protein
LTFRSLGEGGGGSNFFPKASTLTERRYKPFKIQNPTFKIPLLPRPLATSAPWRFRFLPKGIDAHRATRQAIQNPKSNIQNPSSSAMIPVGETPTPLEAPRASTSVAFVSSCKKSESKSLTENHRRFVGSLDRRLT